ncbi:aminoglycoside phosphotransferase (APT) family kinase protein [Agromyces terreus]|uniref:Aminoglycoside phosphotransferase (APT) family kinase protein n=1 Tax=Agromyces terreus TaxID=424795 RepID=A0A9X2KAI9_9MICO|nr:aminoglycoside phosphotransferase family protein [Agromyces terreus]MCP2370388.1 aminoglycoside phosphotransferase (APT) family kinase protein [Agromyces terreus]
MADAPEPDLHVDADLAARLVASQHPDLVGPVRLAGHGWDNVMFRLGPELAVRMPRREIAVPLLLGEQRWLPELAPRLPTAIPVPVRVGRPAPELGYDVPWSIVPWLPGASALAPSSEERGTDAAAEALAAFVIALGVPAPRDAPENPYRGVPLAARDADVRARLARGRAADPEVLGRVWERALAASVWAGPPVWVHGDLHPGNLLVRSDGGLAGVVDFGDLTSGDPATDLATAWLTFGPRGRAAFIAQVGALAAVDDATWERARGWAVVMGTALVDALDAESPYGRLGARILAGVAAEG